MPAAVSAPAPAVPAPAATSVVNGAAKTIAPVVGKDGAVTPVVAPEQTYDIKVNGQLKKMTMAELERYASKGGYADQVTQKAREAIRDAVKARDDYAAKESARLERAKKDTDAFLKEHGIDPDEFARQRLNKRIEDGKMTPEQREAAELKAENQRLKDEHARAEQARKVEAEKAQTTALQRNIEKTLKDAAARVGIEAGDESFYAIYESFREAFELGLLPQDGLQPHHADRIVEDAQARIEGSQKSLEKAVLAGLKGDRLLTRLGPEVVKAVLEARIEQIRGGKGGAVNAPPAPKTAAPVVKPSSYLTPAQADEQMKKLLASGAK